jgi:hypothetical protein
LSRSVDYGGDGTADFRVLFLLRDYRCGEASGSREIHAQTTTKLRPAGGKLQGPTSGSTASALRLRPVESRSAELAPKPPVDRLNRPVPPALSLSNGACRRELVEGSLVDGPVPGLVHGAKRLSLEHSSPKSRSNFAAPLSAPRLASRLSPHRLFPLSAFRRVPLAPPVLSRFPLAALRFRLSAFPLRCRSLLAALSVSICSNLWPSVFLALAFRFRNSSFVIRSMRLGRSLALPPVPYSSPWPKNTP